MTLQLIRQRSDRDCTRIVEEVWSRAAVYDKLDVLDGDVLAGAVLDGDVLLPAGDVIALYSESDTLR